MKNRIEKITELVRGKTVLHVGFADAGCFKEKIKNGTWLHEHVCRSAEWCFGYDTDKEAVNELRSMEYISVCSDLSECYQYKYSLLLFGEVIEHVDNPVSFLTGMKVMFPGANILVTVPNAFRLRNFLNSFRGYEAINYDHRYWFTPFTILKVLGQAGYNNCAYEMIESSKRGLLHRIFLNLFPMFRDTILVTNGL